MAVAERQPVNHARAFDAGQRTRALGQAAVEVAPLLLRVAEERRVDGDDDGVVRGEAGVNRLRVAEALHEERGAGQHDERERHLREDERIAQTQTARTPFSLRLALEHGHEVGPRSLERGREYEDDAGEDRDYEREDVRARVGRDAEIDLEGERG